MRERNLISVRIIYIIYYRFKSNSNSLQSLSCLPESIALFVFFPSSPKNRRRNSTTDSTAAAAGGGPAITITIAWATRGREATGAPVGQGATSIDVAVAGRRRRRLSRSSTVRKRSGACVRFFLRPTGSRLYACTLPISSISLSLSLTLLRGLRPGV